MFEEIVAFIRHLYRQPTGFIPLHQPRFGGNEKRYLEECIDTTFVSSVGKFVDRFEEEMARFTGASKAVACVNGTNALHLALLLVGAETDTEIITQPLTFVATANAIAYCGAKPVFVDVDRDTLGLSPMALKEWLGANSEFKAQGGSGFSRPQAFNKATGRRIAACVPMHTFGHPCRIDGIVAVCDEYGIPVVEDAAESLGSYYKGRHTGTFGRIGILSFNGNKVITTGGGGMLLFDDPELGKRAKHLTTQAKVSHPWEFVHDAVGYNYRMPNINAGLGLAQLEQLPGFLANKRQVAETYREFFSSLDSGISFIAEPENARSNYWLNCILLKDTRERDEFLKYANDAGVMSRPAWRLMHRLPMHEKCPRGDLSNACFLEQRLVNIPSSAV